jgi:glucosylglycerate synthase
VVDSDLRCITPEWVELLLIRPVLRAGVSTSSHRSYHRHKYDGTITNCIVYPLTRALYGKRVRQPIGGDFGFSGRLAEHYLSEDVWSTDVARFGIDIWMTTTAITGGYRVCQSFLGAKIHDVKDPGVDLSAMLVQVVSAVLSLMDTHEDGWKRLAGSEPVPVFGFEYTVGLEPIRVNVERMANIFRNGLKELAAVWEKVLAPETFAAVQKLADVPGDSFRYPGPLWVRTVYDFALAHHRRVLNREFLLKSLTPLYLGRTASFVLETATAEADEVEQVIEDLCLEYERSKGYLTQRWDE